MKDVVIIFGGGLLAIFILVVWGWFERYTERIHMKQALREVEASHHSVVTGQDLKLELFTIGKVRKPHLSWSAINQQWRTDGHGVCAYGLTAKESQLAWTKEVVKLLRPPFRDITGKKHS